MKTVPAGLSPGVYELSPGSRCFLTHWVRGLLPFHPLQGIQGAQEKLKGSELSSEFFRKVQQKLKA